MNTKTFGDVTIKSADQGHVKATIATVGVLDRDGDVMMDGSLTETKVAISPFGHAIWGDGGPPIGYGTFKQDGQHLVFDGRFNMEMQAGREAFADVKLALDEGVNTEWSFSLQDIVATHGEMEGKAARFIKSFRPAEVSRVLQGASIGSGTQAVKATFSEHATKVLADVDGLAERARAVVALRAEKGKSISDESAGLLAQVVASLEAVKAVLDEPDTTTETGAETAEETSPDEVDALFLEYVAITQGVTQS